MSLLHADDAANVPHDGHLAVPHPELRTQNEVRASYDRELVIRAQNGDTSAFVELYTRYYEQIYRLCVYRLRDSREAEDITQETFLRAWRNLERLGGTRLFLPWLRTIASNLCVSLRRGKPHVTSIGMLDMIADLDREDDVMFASPEQTAMLAAALTKLSARHRSILELREEKGLTYLEIARLEGIEVGAVKTLIWRARRALRREFASVRGMDGRVAGIFFAVLGALRNFSESASSCIGQAACAVAPVYAAAAPVAASSMIAVGATVAVAAPVVVGATQHQTAAPTAAKNLVVVTPSVHVGVSSRATIRQADKSDRSVANRSATRHKRIVRTEPLGIPAGQGLSSQDPATPPPAQQSLTAPSTAPANPPSAMSGTPAPTGSASGSATSTAVGSAIGSSPPASSATSPTTSSSGSTTSASTAGAASGTSTASSSSAPTGSSANSTGKASTGSTSTTSSPTSSTSTSAGSLNAAGSTAATPTPDPTTTTTTPTTTTTTPTSSTTTTAVTSSWAALRTQLGIRASVTDATLTLAIRIMFALHPSNPNLTAADLLILRLEFG